MKGNVIAVISRRSVERGRIFIGSDLRAERGRRMEKNAKKQPKTQEVEVEEGTKSEFLPHHSLFFLRHVQKVRTFPSPSPFRLGTASVVNRA